MMRVLHRALALLAGTIGALGSLADRIANLAAGILIAYAFTEAAHGRAADAFFLFAIAAAVLHAGRALMAQADRMRRHVMVTADSKERELET